MKRSGGYHAYRGRGRRWTGRTVLIILAVILVLLILSFVYLSRYLVYTDDGVKLELPFFQREEDKDPVQSDLVVDTPQPTEDPVVEQQGYRAAELPLSALTEGKAKEQLAAKNATAAVFTMKETDGTLHYVAGADAAVSAGVSSADPALNEAIRSANQEEGLYTVAKISCFRDLGMSSDHKSWSIMADSGYRWRDSGKIRWISPANENACSYVLGVMEELCDLGFDEILLVNCGYPTGAKTASIAAGENYPTAPAARQETVTAFLGQAKELADRYGVKLSVLAGAETLETGAGEDGQTAAALTEHCDRIWVDEQESGISYVNDAVRDAAEKKLVTVHAEETGFTGQEQDMQAELSR